MSWGNCFPVYLDNLSPFYVVTLIITILAMILARVYQGKSDHLKGPEKIRFEDIKPFLKFNYEGLPAQLKKAEYRNIQRALVGKAYKDEDEEDETEKEIQAEQLEDIFKLIQKQEENLLVTTTKSQLQQQLKMYRT